MGKDADNGGLAEVEKANKKTVLIVDDEPAIRKLVYRMLGKDYAVLEAQNGEEAVNMAQSRRPDIIIMDMMMPIMDGLTACYTIKMNPLTREIPVVMLTAMSYDLDRKISEDAFGASGYIAKPFTREVLLEEISRLQATA